jgi:hypothetical protein
LPHGRITIFGSTPREGRAAPGRRAATGREVMTLRTRGNELRAFGHLKRLADERRAVTLYGVFEEVPVR